MSTPELAVETEGPMIRLAGRLDAFSSDVVRDTLRKALDTTSGDILVDVAELEIWGPTGFGVLMAAGRYAKRADRCLVLQGVRDRELRMFRRAGLTKASRTHGVLV